MKTLPCICLATILLTITAWSREPAAEPKDHDGIWVAASGEFAGWPIDKKTLSKMKLVIKGNMYTFTLDDCVDKGTFKLNPKAQPMTMDVVVSKGPHTGANILGIYERDGKTLTVCYDRDGVKRPTEFKTTQETGHFLVTWKLKKK